MKMTDLFLAQLDREAPLSQRALDRVPEGRPEWKPHPKSMQLGYLATLVATMPSWIALAVNQDVLDLQGGPRPAAWSTRGDLAKIHADCIEQARAALRGTNDDYLMTSWKLAVGGHVVMESPRHVVIEDTFCHLAHHRGQLTVYLRLNDVAVPSIYGPTADEQTFG